MFFMRAKCTEKHNTLLSFISKTAIFSVFLLIYFTKNICQARYEKCGLRRIQLLNPQSHAEKQREFHVSKINNDTETF